MVHLIGDLGADLKYKNYFKARDAKKMSKKVVFKTTINVHRFDSADSIIGGKLEEAQLDQ